MSRRLGPVALIFLAASAFVLVNAVPSSFDMFGIEPAFAKKGGNGGGGGGNGGGGGKSKGSKGGSHASAGGSNGKSGTASGKTKLKGTTTLASSNAKALGTKSPKSVVRQYVLANGLKQGDIASLLKSWNSLNRNPQAYLNHLDKPNSLPGLQIAYIRGNMDAEAALAAFETLGGDPLSPPTEEQSVAAELAVDQYDAWVAYQAEPDPVAQADLLAAFEALGGDPLAPPTEEQSIAAQSLVDQFGAWTSFQGAETFAQDAFMAASVSYKGGVYDEAIFGELRQHVDAIVGLKGLDTLIAESDAAAETPEPTEPSEPEIILPE